MSVRSLFPNLSRRTWLLSGAAAIGAGAVGAVWLSGAHPRELVFALMQRELPGVDLDPESVGECAQDVIDRIDETFEDGSTTKLISHLKLRGVRAASEIIGADGVMRLAPLHERLEEIARLAITQLLPNSNFFQASDPRAERIYYQRPDPNAACVNPFANLTPPPPRD